MKVELGKFLEVMGIPYKDIHLFKEAFTHYFRSDKRVHDEDKILLNYLLSTLMYMKPISSPEKIGGDIKPYIFQDECE